MHLSLQNSGQGLLGSGTGRVTTEVTPIAKPVPEGRPRGRQEYLGQPRTRHRVPGAEGYRVTLTCLPSTLLHPEQLPQPEAGLRGGLGSQQSFKKGDGLVGVLFPPRCLVVGEEARILLVKARNPSGWYPGSAGELSHGAGPSTAYTGDPEPVQAKKKRSSCGFLRATFKWHCQGTVVCTRWGTSGRERDK